MKWLCTSFVVCICAWLVVVVFGLGLRIHSLQQQLQAAQSDIVHFEAYRHNQREAHRVMRGFVHAELRDQCLSMPFLVPSDTPHEECNTAANAQANVRAHALLFTASCDPAFPYAAGPCHAAYVLKHLLAAAEEAGDQ